MYNGVSRLVHVHQSLRTVFFGLGAGRSFSCGPACPANNPRWNTSFAPACLPGTKTCGPLGRYGLAIKPFAVADKEALLEARFIVWVTLGCFACNA